MKMCIAILLGARHCVQCSEIFWHHCLDFQTIFKAVFLSFFLAVLGLHCCVGISLVVMPTLLIAEASLVVVHRL